MRCRPPTQIFTLHEPVPNHAAEKKSDSRRSRTTSQDEAASGEKRRTSKVGEKKTTDATKQFRQVVADDVFLLYSNRKTSNLYIMYVNV